MKASKLFEEEFQNMLGTMTLTEREQMMNAYAEVEALIAGVDLGSMLDTVSLLDSTGIDYERLLQEIACPGGIDFLTLAQSTIPSALLSSVPPEDLDGTATAELMAEMTGMLSGIDPSTYVGLGVDATALGALSQAEALGVYGDVTGVLAGFHDLYDDLANARTPEWGALSSALQSAQAFLGNVVPDERHEPLVIDGTGEVAVLAVSVTGSDSLQTPGDDSTAQSEVLVPRILIDLMILAIALLPSLMLDASGDRGQQIYAEIPSTVDTAAALWLIILVHYRNRIHALFGHSTADDDA